MEYLSNFWGTLQMLLVNCKIYLYLSWQIKCLIASSTYSATFTITNTKIYVLVVILPTQYNSKLLEQLESGIRRIIYWNRYQPKIAIQAQNQYLDCLIDLRLQEMNRLFESLHDKTIYTGYFLPKVEINNYNAMIDGLKKFLKNLLKIA